MRKALLLPIAAAVSAALSSIALAGPVPVPAPGDSRIQSADYSAEAVYPVSAAPGAITTIVFSETEKVLSFGSGYSSAWEFASRGNHFFLKPKARHADTNLVVVTSKRTYHFDLKLVSSPKRSTYSLAFRYPEEEQREAAKRAKTNRTKELLSRSSEGKAVRNTDYTMNFGPEGSRSIAPAAAWDDGVFTYFRFLASDDFPAAYRVTPDGEESLVQSHVEGDLLVLHGVFREVRLRSGTLVVGIYAGDHETAAERPEVTVPGVRRTVVGNPDETAGGFGND